MSNSKHTGFLGNIVHGEKLDTAWGARFYEGFTTMRFDNLDEQVEGYDMVLDKNLKALLPYKDALSEGKRVDVHLEWELTEDRMDYKSAEVLKVEVNE